MGCRPDTNKSQTPEWPPETNWPEAFMVVACVLGMMGFILGLVWMGGG